MSRVILLCLGIDDYVQLRNEGTVSVAGECEPCKGEYALIALLPFANGRGLSVSTAGVVASAVRVRTGAQSIVHIRFAPDWGLERPFESDDVGLPSAEQVKSGHVQRVGVSVRERILAQQFLRPGSQIDSASGLSGPDHREMCDQFHLLWGKAVGKDDYVKAEWQRLRFLLLERGVRT